MKLHIDWATITFVILAICKLLGFVTCSWWLIAGITLVVAIIQD